MVATSKVSLNMYGIALLVMGVPSTNSIMVLENTNRHIHHHNASHTTAHEQACSTFTSSDTCPSGCIWTGSECKVQFTFELPYTPITGPSLDMNTVTSDQWPADFCIAIDVTTPPTVGQYQEFGLIGGSSSVCEGIYLMLRQSHRVGFGVQCNADGSDLGLMTDDAYTVDGSRHVFAFCYSTVSRIAKVCVDGSLAATGTRNFNFDRYGSISIFNGLHYTSNNQMTGATLHALSISEASNDDCPQVRATCGDADGAGASNSATTCPNGYVAKSGVDSTVCAGTVCDTSTSISTDTATCCEATPSPTPSPTPNVGAAGDPHLQNVRGERFDVLQEGSHVLINIPRGMSAENSLLRVTAGAVRLGGHCADMYFQDINITGSWAEAKHVGGYQYSVSQGTAETPEWAAFGKVELKVVHGHMDSGITYLNFYAKHLGRTGFDVGGLLGLDGHDDVMTPPAACSKQMSLKGLKTTETSLQAFPNSVSSIAMATFE